MHISSYPKIYNFGHRAVKDILKAPVVVQEKVDGSQISFAKFDGKVEVKSKRAAIDIDNPDNMFRTAVKQILALEDKMCPGWIYRGEYLQRPKHNVLKYNRVPEGHIVLFDIEHEPGTYDFLTPEQVAREAEYMGLEVVPTYKVLVSDLEGLRKLLDQESFLGGPKVEGIVVKAYDLFNPIDGKTLMAKHVSESFRESHSKKAYGPTSNKDIIQQMIDRYKTEARWQKAVQHLREEGKLEDSPRDIGTVLKEIGQDTLEECGDEIKEAVFKWAWKQISKGIIAGFPEWYKEQLLQQQFEEVV